MSTLIIEKVKVNAVTKHPHADRLDIIKCFDWDVVVQSGQYKVGDDVIYIPVGTILSQDLEIALFPPDSKIKLHHRRIKSIKIRGMISQGFVIDPRKFDLEYVKANVTKYETPEKALPSHMGVKKSKKAVNKNFNKYTDIENFKYYDRSIQDGDNIYISEKLHGTSFRAGWFRNEPNTLWKKVLNLFGVMPDWEFCWGSRTVQIQNKLYHRGYYTTDVYTKMVNQYNLKNIIPKGKAVYGEIVGDKIQSNYNYGCGKDEHKLFVYDVLNTETKEWLNYNEFIKNVETMELTPVPNLYVGPFKRDIAEKLRTGNSTVGKQRIREGIVIRPTIEMKTGALNRLILKFINDEYYVNQDKLDGTEFH